ncbi:MAG: MCE family protein [Nitrospinae bacterium]|nr:MCE family protein [Nitrospinota bacterium]
MEYRSSEIKAGLFIFVSFLVLCAMIFSLGNIKQYFKPQKKLRIAFAFTGGLELGAQVRYAGLSVGRVSAIGLLDAKGKPGAERVLVEAAVDPAIDIKKNAAAMIKTSGLMGSLYIDIRPGSSKAPSLAENELLEGTESFEFAKIGDIMTEFVRQVERFTNIADVLVSDSKGAISKLEESLGTIHQVVSENRGSIHSNLRNMEKITSELAGLMDRDDGQLRETLAHVSSVASKTDRLLTEKEQGIYEIIDQTRHMTRELELLLVDNRPGITSMVRAIEADAHRLSGKIEAVAANLDQAVGQTNGVLTENRRNVMELVKNLKETSSALKEFSDEIKRNPWKLVRKTDEKTPKEPDKAGAALQPDSQRMKRLDKISAK